MAVKVRFGCKVRAVELNLPQRCAGHLFSATDIKESVAIGKEAVRVAGEGITGEMMIFERVSDEPYSCGVSHKKVSEIANMVKKVPDEYITEDGSFVTEECCKYILPLIEGEIAPKYEKGIPNYIVL